MATDEIAGMAMSAAQKGMEILAELIKLLAQATPKLFGGAIDITKFFEEKVAAKKAVGEVSRKNLFVAANNAKSPIVSNDNFLKSDMDKITAKAKKYGVPVSVVGNGEKQSISYLERDKDVVNQIMNELVSERLTENSQSVKSFTISEGGISAMKAEFDKNGLDCAFVQSADGKYHCIYPAEDAARVAVVKEDYKKVVNEVAEQFKIERNVPESEMQAQLKEQIADLQEQYNSEVESTYFEDNSELKNRMLDEAERYKPQIEKLQEELKAETARNFEQSSKEIILSDGENSVTLSADDTLTKAKVKELLKEDFGYSDTKADLAANKMCDDLGLDRDKFLAQPTQIDNIEFLRTNIKYDNDDLTIRDLTFSAVNFKDGENSHIFITNGESSAALTPATMTQTEMHNICVQHLGMSEEQANAAVQKAVKIDTQINSRLKETTYNRDGTQQTAEIERTSKNSFTVKVGEKLRCYDFTQIGVEDKISEDFGIPKANVKNVIDKAKKQSVLSNNIKNAAKKKAKKSTDKLQDVKTKIGKGARK